MKRPWRQLTPHRACAGQFAPRVRFAPAMVEQYQWRSRRVRLICGAPQSDRRQRLGCKSARTPLLHPSHRTDDGQAGCGTYMPTTSPLLSLHLTPCQAQALATPTVHPVRLLSAAKADQLTTSRVNCSSRSAARDGDPTANQHNVETLEGAFETALVFEHSTKSTEVDERRAGA